MKNQSIKIGSGLDEILFGISREELKSKLGEPDEVEFIPPEEEEDGSLEAWHYDDLELSATFDEIEDWRLTSLAVSSPTYLFESTNLIGQTQEEATRQIELMGLGELEMEVLTDGNGSEQEVASIPDLSLNFWFEEGQLTEIQWGPLWDEEEENYIWPNS